MWKVARWYVLPTMPSGIYKFTGFTEGTEHPRTCSGYCLS